MERRQQAYDARVAAETVATQAAEQRAAAAAQAEAAARLELDMAARSYSHMLRVWPQTEADVENYERYIAPEVERARLRYEAAEEAVNGPNWRERRHRQWEMMTEGALEWR